MNPRRVILWSTMVLVALSMAFVSTSAAQPTVFDEMTPGSFLVFPVFDVRAGYETEIRITNTGPSTVQVQLNFVCPGTKKDPYCDALDRHIEITQYGTYVVKVNEFNPPCHEGFVVAFAENGAYQAVAFDYLIGSYHIGAAGRQESAPAISIQSEQAQGTVLGTALQFGDNGAHYRALPTDLWTDFRATDNGDDGVGSYLVLLTLDTIAGAANPVTNVDIDFWNEDEVPFSTSWEYVCWTRVPLEKIDDNFFKDNLGTAKGALKVRGAPTCPVAGGCPPLQDFNPAILGAINEYDAASWSKRNLFHDRVPKSTVFFPR